MCGIAGITRFRGEGDDLGSIERMLRCLERRGPDDSGVVVSDSTVLGNRRLAILDLSPAGRQPMQSPSGRFWITFNGEIYNHAEIREELGLERRDLRSSSDTEILLRAWERWGPACLERFVGQWAFAIYDAREKVTWLARDRFGEKPLFYHLSERRLAFASSLGSLMQEPETKRELDPAALTEYLTLRYVVAPRTILRDVRKLPGGRLLEIAADGSVREQVWYEPRFRVTNERRTRETLVEAFGERLERASARCLVSDVPVALLLSDGIDSNAVRAALSAGGHRPPSYTFRLGDGDGESGAAPARVMEGDGGPVHDLTAGRADRLQSMSEAFARLTEPVGDGAALATWMLIKNARDHATVFLCGHGGDEVLGGYRLSQDRFRLAALRVLARLPMAWMCSPLGRFLYGDEPLSVRRERLLAASPETVPAAARYLIHRPLPPGDVRRLLGGPGTLPERYLGTVDRLYEGCEGSAGDLDRMQEVMLRTFLSENILSFADSVAMDSSAELRMPFLDRDLVEFVLGLPAASRVGRLPGRTNTKRILRWWADGRVPPEVVRRRKRAFQFGSLPGLLRRDGATLRARILDVEAVRSHLPGAEAWLTAAPESFRGPWEGTLWALLALAIWCEANDVRG